MWGPFYKYEYRTKMVCRTILVAIGYVCAAAVAIPASPFVLMGYCVVNIRRRVRRKRARSRMTRAPAEVDDGRDDDLTL